MTRRNTNPLLDRHHREARRLLDQLTGAGGRPSRREMTGARAKLAYHLTQHQLIADAEGLHLPRRDWMLRALRDATDDALPAVARLLRRELAERPRAA
jgi:hypothetical protein